MMERFEYVSPGTVDEALKYLASEKATAKAGGIDLLDLMKEGLSSPSRIVNLLGIASLRTITGDAAAGIRIGAGVTLAEVGDHPEIAQRYAALSMAARGAATPQIRNAATIAGNLCQRPRCWYFRSADFPCLRKGGDTCYAQEGENRYHAVFDNGLCAIVHPSAIAIALMALRARVTITNGKTTREVPLDGFFVSPEEDVRRETTLKQGELILDVIVPPAGNSSASSYLKLKEKQSFDWPLAEAAVVFHLDGTVCRDASVVLGAAAPVPMRVQAVEAFLRGKEITPATARAAARLPFDKATPLRDNGYKVQLLKTALRRTILAAAGRDPMKEE